MSDKDSSGVPFASDDSNEQKLWSELERLPHAEPSPRLRQKFYSALDKASRPSIVGRLRDWLGLNGTAGLATAMGCLVVGLAVGQLLSNASPLDNEEFSALEQQVAMLNRNLILDRLENDSASKRLLGVIDAVGVAEHDAEVARALLARAVDDSVYSVRSAAIDALGPQLSTPAVGDELMALLEATDSPLVQLALVDLVLRHGSVEQLEHLLRLSELGLLHSDLVQHVKTSVRRDTV